MSNISVNDAIKEMMIAKDLMSMRVVLLEKKEDLEYEIGTLNSKKYPKEFVNIYNNFKANCKNWDQKALDELLEYYGKKEKEEINESKKKIKKIKFIFFGYFIFCILTLVILIVLYNLGYFTILFVFFALGILGAIISVTDGERKEAKKKIMYWKENSYHSIVFDEEEILKYSEELRKIESNLAKSDSLIKEAKKTMIVLPKKYVDYISPFDSVPAIFDLIEIVNNKRASTIKELINVYLDDEFKKEQRNRITSIEEKMNRQSAIVNSMTNKITNLSNNTKKQIEYLSNIEKRIKELNKNIPTSIDVKIID